MSLQPHLIGYNSLSIAHNLIIAHIVIMNIAKAENVIMRGRKLVGLTKLGVTPGGGEMTPICARTESGI